MGTRVRRVRSAVVVASVVSVLGLTSAPSLFHGSAAHAAPPRSTADQIFARYQQLSRAAEQSAEAMHNAQAEYTKQRRIVADAQRSAAASQTTLDTTQKRLDEYQHKIDSIVRAQYKGARVNRLYAVLVSDSPQQVLDQMSGLEMLSRRTATDFKNLKEQRKRTEAAKQQADTTASSATQAVSAAERERDGVRKKQAELQLQAVQVRAVYQSMTGKQLAQLRGPKVNFDPRSLGPDTSPELAAVQAALTRIGDAYVWGATGPDTFDCSGLMVWSYRQAGKALPRSSQAQLGSGQPVDRNDLKPGDLVIYYPDASHVGMYVGDGYVVHAATFGVPVAVVPLDKAGPYNSARRY